MKLKSIMYALGYGKARKQLVRSEGARRVKQAEKMAYERCKILRDGTNTVVHISKERSQGLTGTFKYMFGDFDEVK